MEPNQKDAKTETPPVTGPQPKGPTPLEVVEIYYNKIWRVAPLVVSTQEAKDALDLSEWTLDPVHMTPPGGPVTAHYPKLFFNINVPPLVVGTAEYAQSLGANYREFAISKDLAKASEATAADAEKAAHAKQDKPAPSHK